MKNVAILLRAMQLYAHAAHNLTHGKEFFQDHDFLGDLYPVYEADYDNVVERMIGLKGDCDINAITKAACNIATSAKLGESPFAVLLATEKNLCDVIAKEMSASSNGTQNLLQDIADRSEMRQYKLSRRLR